MNASNLQMKLTFKNKVVSAVSKFNRKHKALSFLGIAYALFAITVYNILFYFYRNAKRHICLACILLFFVFSSSFSYPAMSLNISFATDMSIEDYSADDYICAIHPCSFFVVERPLFNHNSALPSTEKIRAKILYARFLRDKRRQN